MILFVIIFNITEIVVAVVVAVQFLIKLFTGKVNAQLQALGQSLGAYFSEIVCFLTFHSEDMPYPFAHFPAGAPGATAAAAPPAKTKRPRRAKGKAEDEGAAKPEAGD
jgi:hypothetical protein